MRAARRRREAARCYHGARPLLRRAAGATRSVKGAARYAASRVCRCVMTAAECSQRQIMPPRCTRSALRDFNANCRRVWRHLSRLFFLIIFSPADYSRLHSSLSHIRFSRMPSTRVARSGDAKSAARQTMSASRCARAVCAIAYAASCEKRMIRAAMRCRTAVRGVLPPCNEARMRGALFTARASVVAPATCHMQRMTQTPRRLFDAERHCAACDYAR